ncbi:MAG: hypothetical protein WCH32_10050 [Pseudomonadota bacterium]
MRRTTGLASLVALCVAAVAGAADFEAVPMEPPAASLSPAQCAGEAFHVEDPVVSDGLMRHYLVISRYGAFEGYGRPGLTARLREVAALEELQKTSGVGVVADAVGESVTGSARTLVEVATHPIDTVTGIPRGIGHLFQGFAADARELGDTAASLNEKPPDGAAKAGSNNGVSVSDARRYAARYFGVTASERRWFQRLGVDPYTDNELLRRAVHRYAKIDATTKFGLKFAPIPGLPYAGEARRAMDAIYSEPPAVLRARRRTVLAGYGLTADEIKRFDNALLLNPTRQQLLESAAESMPGVAGRGELFRHATTLLSEHEVMVFIRSAVLLAEVHAREPLASILPGLRLPAARTAAGQVVVAGAFDALYWTAVVEEAERAMRAALGSAEAPIQVWVSGDVSARAETELAARGWQVRALPAATAAMP